MGLFERLFGKKDKAKVAEQEAATTEVLSEDITSKDTIESEKEALSDTNAHAVAADVVSVTDDISKQAELSDEAASEQAEGLDPAARGAFLLEREPELELAATDDKTLDQAGESLSQHEAMEEAKHDRAKSEHSNESADASTEDQAETNAEYQVAAQAPAGSADQPAEEGQKQETLSAESDQEKYKRSLKKTRTGFSARLNSFFANFRRVDEDFFEDLEELLILSDVGVHVATTLTEELRYEAKLENAKKPEALKRLIIEKLVAIYEGDGRYNEAIHYQQDLTVMLFVGVNGVGKTTSIGKLAYRYKQEGKKVMLVAADTFRAGAVAQLVEWGRRVDVPVITGPEKADPASVVFDGVERAVAEKADILLIDTAGRLQNKDNLMAELEKIGRIIKRVIPDAPHETLLALDASTGQNALSQAKEFSKITPLTGLILTKIDGTAKGGIVLAIRQELDIPVKLIGFGEAIDDIGEFHSEDFMKGLLEGIL
ncbi:signal recognition particle-docking protein FtsY [Streptococcus equi]|uniref:signal recognition particle-docking protein FtsY n=1 Tax=Streptococcus equi TaxID=1336 RepID=UPI001E351711|nr:signal recognition particle-docking protein FtsY [Streptococcus equi]MCD3368341.1 signal recognition particle-docking protein FtsY [Streptococcus equi subsp. zooepidemicus]MCD3448296.1 signal recognition particle-docking protein FtsY [Streptococcus equi subsp. zooepidemicus]